MLRGQPALEMRGTGGRLGGRETAIVEPKFAGALLEGDLQRDWALAVWN